MPHKVLSEYTPGPWHIESRAFDTVIVPSNDSENDDDGYAGRHIAIVRSGLNGKQGLGYSGPNARLIAAAPDLLSALKSAIQTSEFENHPFRPWHEEARVAIAKAEGSAQ